MKTPSPRRATLLALSALTLAASAPHPAIAAEAPASAAKTDDDVVEADPFVVTEKARGIVPFLGNFRYSRFTQRVKTPVIVTGAIRRHRLQDFDVSPGERIISVDGKEITDLTRAELIRLWMEAGEAGDPLTVVVSPDPKKGGVPRVLKIKRASARPPVSADVSKAADAIVNRVRARQLRDETDFSAEFSELDALLAQHDGEKSEDAAHIAFAKATLHFLARWDYPAAEEALAALQKNYPGTVAARDAPAARALLSRPAPPLTFQWSTRASLKSLDDLKGKVVVLVFWATGSRPSLAALPHLKFVADHYAGKPVEIINVTSLLGRIDGLEPKPIDTRGKPEKEIALIKKFVGEKGLGLTFAVSHQPLPPPDYALQQIPSLTLIASDGAIRETGLSPLMPLRAKIDALLNEAGLSPPPSP